MFPQRLSRQLTNYFTVYLYSASLRPPFTRIMGQTLFQIDIAPVLKES